MITRSRVRSTCQVAQAFATEDPDFEDSESEDEEEDHIETESANESESDADSDDESEEDAENEPLSKRRRGRIPYLLSKSGYAWSQKPPELRGRRRSLIEHDVTLKSDALNAKTPLEAWSVLFTDEILNIIVTHTNEEIDRNVAKITENGSHVQTYHKSVDLVELKAFLGLLYFAGLQKVNHTSTKNLWSPHGLSLFRLTMPENRFLFLMDSLRFDDKNTRAERQATDRLACVREIWDLFIANCTASYDPGTYCTIDAQLLSFRGKCAFRMYMPAKPDKYGLKVVTMNDAVTHYMLAAIPYVGVVDKDPSEAVPSYYVRKLSESIHHTGRNITCDNWFTSIPICEKMKAEYNLTMVGTIRKNKREIPEQFKKMPPAGTNVQFAHHEGKTLVSYNPKAKKIVLLLSSLHTSGKIDAATKKPEIVLIYNKTKGGTDSFDKKCHDYTTARRTRRWPMRFVYGMLDQANVNSLILYILREENVKMKRTEFILDLSMALIKPLLARRLASSALRIRLRLQIEALVQETDIPEDDPMNLLAENKMAKQKRCRFCPVALDRKTYYKCLKCQMPMCKEHVAKVCCNCSVQMNR